MNNSQIISIIDSLPSFASHFLNIRTKSGEIRKFELNRAQQYIHDRLENQLKKTGKVRALILKGRQQGCCYSPNTKILTSNYQWIPIEKTEIGQKLWSIDETPQGKTKHGRNNERRIRVATIEAKAYLMREAFEVTLSNGIILKVTGEHKHLCKQRGGCAPQWRAINDCIPGDFIRAFCPPPTETELNYEAGWIGGLLDGEGSFGAYPAARIALSQVDGPVLRKYKNYLDKLNIKYYELIDKRDCGSYSKMGDKPVHCIRVDRQADVIRLLTQTNPIRFINKPVFEGKKLPKDCPGFESWVTILSIKPIGKIKVIDLQTSEKTFIAEGLVSHNSTYVQARYFHKVITQSGKKAFILTHEAEATKNLFDMAKRYYDSLPHGLAPKSDASNAKELNFKSLNSGYSVGTAGNKAVGRSQTIQLMHASEVAYYQHAEEHAKGILQAVSNENDTEIIMESTANGIGNYFYNIWVSATTGKSEFQAIFIPWFWQSEYTAQPRENETVSLSEEEEQLLNEHKENGLTIEHLYWRRRKLHEFSNDHETAKELFSVEYPMTALDAFRNPIADRFIKADLVQKARRNKVESSSLLVIGVDVAISDHDRTAIIRRKGRVAYNLETYHNLNTMELVGLIRRIIDKERPSKLCIDIIGIGQGCYDRLRELGYDCVEGVNVARSANDKDKFRNLRAELWHDMREWMAQETPVQIPNSDELLGDLTSLGYKFDSSGRLQIESKEELRKRGMKSPDCFVAGTLIDTPAGKIAIEKLLPGDLVSTPMGNRRIIKNWESETDALTTIEFTNGIKVSARPSHKVFTWGRGWVNIDSIKLTDRVESNSWINKAKWKLLNLFYITESNLEFKAQVDTIQQTKKLNPKDFFIVRSGMTILEKFQKDFISITKMAIGKIMMLPILNVSMGFYTEEITCLSLCRNQNIEKKHLKPKRKPFLKLQNGINQMRENYGILNMEEIPGKKGIKKTLNALFAKMNSKHFFQPENPPGFAQENVHNLDVIQNKKHYKKNAFIAKIHLWLTNIGILNFVLKSVHQEIVLKTKVYNLTLDSENVYYANGILVANCADALALTFIMGDYLTNSNFNINRIPPKAAGMFI